MIVPDAIAGMHPPAPRPVLGLPAWIILVLLALIPRAEAEAASPAAQALPFVYTQWEHFTVKEGLPNDQHGVTNDMTKDQLNDLIEYLKTL